MDSLVIVFVGEEFEHDFFIIGMKFKPNNVTGVFD